MTTPTAPSPNDAAPYATRLTKVEEYSHVIVRSSLNRAQGPAALDERSRVTLAERRGVIVNLFGGGDSFARRARPSRARAADADTTRRRRRGLDCSSILAPSVRRGTTGV